MAAPWLMWGSSQNVTPTVAALPSQGNQVSSQIARVNYGRPETWSFFFAASVDQTDPAAAAATFQVLVFWDLVIGVGRAQISMPVFGFFAFQSTGAGLVGLKKWTSVVLAPELNDPGPSFRPTLDQFVASDIQLVARIAAFQGGGGAAVGTKVRVTVEGFFAPKTHVRPDWYESPARFNGGEQKGA